MYSSSGGAANYVYKAIHFKGPVNTLGITGNALKVAFLLVEPAFRGPLLVVFLGMAAKGEQCKFVLSVSPTLVTKS